MPERFMVLYQWRSVLNFFFKFGIEKLKVSIIEGGLAKIFEFYNPDSYNNPYETL